MVVLVGLADEQVKRPGVSRKPSCGGGVQPPNRHAWAARTGPSAAASQPQLLTPHRTRPSRVYGAGVEPA